MQTPLNRIFLSAFLTLLIALFTIPGFRSHIFFLNFVDEDDNIVIASLMNEGKELYRDVYSQHQPLPFYLSSSLQNILDPDNILMNVKRHREFMMFWSLGWIFLLTFRFGWPLFAASFVIELSKINLLGNLFLAESLVVYPLLYVLSYFIFQKKFPLNGEHWCVIILIWVLILSLAPIWPLLGAMFIYLLYCSHHRFATSTRIALVGVILGFAVFSRGTFLYFWHDVVYINYQFYIPLTTPIGMGESVVKAFLAPIIVFFSQEHTLLLGFIQLLSLSFLLELFWLCRDKQYLRALGWVAVLFLVNIRYIDPSNTLYGAFHMLPWVSVFILAVFVELARLWTAQGLKQLTAKFIVIILTLSTLSLASSTLWDVRDPANDFYINYSPSVDIAKVVEILSRDRQHSIWVEPVMYWPYWQTGAKQYSEMINYYGWMDQTPPLRDSLDALLDSELPTIVWAKTHDGIGPYLDRYLQFRRDGKPVDLYLRQDKLSEISESALQELDYYRFEIN